MTRYLLWFRLFLIWGLAMIASALVTTRMDLDTTETPTAFQPDDLNTGNCSDPSDPHVVSLLLPEEYLDLDDLCMTESFLLPDEDPEETTHGETTTTTVTGITTSVTETKGVRVTAATKETMITSKSTDPATSTSKSTSSAPGSIPSITSISTSTTSSSNAILSTQSSIMQPTETKLHEKQTLVTEPTMDHPSVSLPISVPVSTSPDASTATKSPDLTSTKGTTTNDKTQGTTKSSGPKTASDHVTRTTEMQPSTATSTGPSSTPTVSLVTSTTDWRSKPEATTPATSTSPTTKTSIISVTPNGMRTTSKTSTTAPEFCEKSCPDGYFESEQGCLYLYGLTTSYSNGLGNCQALQNGDMINEVDIEHNFDGIKRLMAKFKLPAHNFYVNGYMGDLNRKEKKARVMWISATTHLLTRNVTTVPRGEDQIGVGTICKVPKHCLRWSCPLTYALQDAPYIEFDTPVPNAPLQYNEPIKYRCKDQEVSNSRWDAFCTERGVIGPAASLFNPSCAPEAKPKPVPPPDYIREELIPDLKCSQCFGMGTERCELGETGKPDKCLCKEGWSMQTCWRFPKFCPNTTCLFESHCEERVDHAICVCDTDRCEVEMRALNRSAEMKFLDSATMIAGPTFEFIVKMIMQVLTPDRGETIQDSIQFYRQQFVSCSGIFYAFGGAPQVMKLEIAERRAMSMMFHLPQILVHLLYALEVMHIDAVRAGRSDNQWKSSGKDKNRWDYGWTYCSTIILGSAFSMGIWYFNWNTHQKAYTSLGIADEGSLGMLGWTSIAYCLCAVYSFFKSMDIYLNGNRKKLETMRRDNKYETSKDPKEQEIEDKVWRNLIPCMIGAPLQCLYSISMIAILAFDDKILKYINLFLLLCNFIANIHQSLRCDQPFLAWQLKWRMMTFRPLKEEFNNYSYLTTSEHFAQRSRKLYEKNQGERREVEEAKRKEELDKIKERIKKFEELGIPRQFHPHLPLKGPAPLKNYEYDPCEKDYIPEREREWRYCEWTKEYLGARIKLTITVRDAIKHVKNGLQDCGFLRGDDCPKKQAKTMFKEWADMMELQDGMDFVEANDAEKLFYENIPAKFWDDMRGLSVACRVKEAGIDMKKQRLLEPVEQIFTFSCPEKEEAGPGLWADPFGFLWEKKVIKDLPVITREQETTIWNCLMNDNRKHNRLRDIIYDDDTLYETLTKPENKENEQPWEAAVRREMNVKSAFPEGPKATHSINPRKHAVDYAELKQNRPDFCGPRQPQYYIPCGPRVRRFWLESYYAPRRELIFRMLCEQAGVRRHNWITRNLLRTRR